MELKKLLSERCTYYYVVHTRNKIILRDRITHEKAWRLVSDDKENRKSICFYGADEWKKFSEKDIKWK